MRKIIIPIAVSILLAACAIPGSRQPAAAPCGDGLCRGPENALNCPADCGAMVPPATARVPEPGSKPTTPPDSAPRGGSQLESAGLANTYWVTNPSSGARLYVQVFYPANWNNTDLLPALVLMPGGIAASDPARAANLAKQGFLIIIFDADGRGKSGGVEDYNGTITQDGLAAVIVAATQLQGLDLDRYGLTSYSYGVTAATGVLARHPDLPIRFYIDWEGPVDRNYTTTGCTLNTTKTGGIQWQPCSEEAWWVQREAIRFIVEVQVPYQRIQSQKDHVQPNNNHAIDIVNAAVADGVPWVRLNEYPPNQTYDKNSPPAMLPDELDWQLEQTVTLYATYIIKNVLPTLP